MLDEILPSFSTWLPLLTLATLSTLYLIIKPSITRREPPAIKGCEPPPACAQKAYLLGFDVAWDTIQAVRSKRFLQSILQSYLQNGKTFTKRIFGSTIICTIEPRNLKSVLATNFKDYGITDTRKNALRPLLGQNILIAEGQEWTHARATLRPSFSKEWTSDLAMFESHIQKLIRAVDRHERAIVDLQPLFLELMGDVMTDFLYGRSITSSDYSIIPSAITEAFEVAQRGCGQRGQWGKLINCFPQVQFFKSIEALRQYVERRIVEGLEHSPIHDGRSYDDTQGEKERYILLHELGRALHDKIRLRDELLTVFVAGHDTTASLLSSMFFTLAKNPSVWLRLRAEVEQLRGEKPTFEQLMEMRYFRCCLNETLRLYPPLPLNARVALKDTTLPTGGGPEGLSPIFVPAGTKIEFHISALHRSKDLWSQDAEEFRPERWDSDKPTASWSFLAFGGGPKSCLGQQFASTVALYTAVRIVQAYEKCEESDKQPWMEELHVVCSLANGAKVTMIPEKGRK